MSTILPMTREAIASGAFPVRHLSPSSISEFANDQRMFFKKYIRYEFDNTSNPSFLAWTSIHKAAERAVEAYMKDGSISSVDECIAWGLAERDRKLDELAIYAMAKLIEERGAILPGDPSFMRDWTDAEVREFLAKTREILEMSITFDEVSAKYPEAREFDEVDDWNGNLSEVKNAEYDMYAVAVANALFEENRYNFLELGKTGSLEEIENMIRFGCKNFAEWHAVDCATEGYTPRGVEVKEVVYFKDEHGEDMPIPLKGILDRWDETDDGQVVTKDYKSVDKFEEDADYKYELASGAYFFVVQAITGKIPKAIEFIEIMKKEPKVVWLADPSRKMLQADLKEEATKAGLTFDKFVKNAVLEEMLVAQGLMGKPSPVRTIRIDYSEKPHVVGAFLYMYKATVNQLAFLDAFIPNLRSWQAKESWADLIEEVQGGKDWMEQIAEDTKKRSEAADDGFDW